MGHRFFSTKDRPVHLGPYPLERLKRTDRPDGRAAETAPLSFRDLKTPHSLVGAMGEYQAMMDAIRDGQVNTARAKTPGDPEERSAHLKSFGYFSDASMVGTCALSDTARLATPTQNPDIPRLAEALRTRQTKTLASGIDLIMADLRDAMSAPPSGIDTHTHAIVFLYEHHRDPDPAEPGAEWIIDAQDHRACLRATETACVIANYLRVLGYAAKAHSPTSSDVNLAEVAAQAGLTWADGSAPFVKGYGLAVVTTDFALAADRPLAPRAQQPRGGLAWQIGKGTAKSARNRDPYAKRPYAMGAWPFERLKRVEDPTTYIDEPNVARVPKRADMFARAQFGDMGKPNQDMAKGGYYVRKAPTSMAQRRALGAFVLLQDGPAAQTGPKPTEAEKNAANVKAAAYFLGVDAVGISRCPDWTWYSHDATGTPIDPPHDQAISMIIDQGYETMEGASGDDWISCAQSMRAYLRFSLLGGVIAQQIRNMGYQAKAHTVMDGEVLQPPLLLLAGLGEVSRIGEVILNPYLGPRLKSGVVTTDMPLAHDKPIDFGLQNFCENCNKCARECPSGAITAGTKLMFNGYEIWKSDSQKCASYRITTEGGAMCGRCMKTCPWNLEGLFAEAPIRWAASNIPKAAPILAKLDDKAKRGALNPVKKWWWDLELQDTGGYEPTQKPKNERELQTNLNLKYEDQTLAVYPAPLAPHPWPYPFPMDREAGIEAYQAMITAQEYKLKLERGESDHIHHYTVPGDAPVLRVEVTEAVEMTPGLTKYRLEPLDGKPLPEWTAGAHLDVVVAPEFLRQYSMSGNPADRTHYEIGVLREPTGRGGSNLLHRIFTPGRKIFISKPINHFELAEDAVMSHLMAGGIGITPMIAFAHRLHALGRDFALHYCISSRKTAGYLPELQAMPWADKVQLHIKDEGTRADLAALIPTYTEGHHTYTCGPDRFMTGVMETGTAKGFPEEAQHLEYFSTPELPDYENHPFTLELAQSGKTIEVAAEETATDALARAGVHVDVKCADGICGVCKCGLLEGEAEHRDFVLSKAQRRDAIILCQSRAATPGGTLKINL
ncbi:reductive dehalogenase [Alphaproteobacteria bacterium KMM 3653]|uniref:Reductive dehalogenase n=1 Tax=Harenicola maris TaxID=2841044 RepID=A0AAP2CQ51_9RHOB|nr:reductive dehalogenase [Harenicola maris]